MFSIFMLMLGETNNRNRGLETETDDLLYKTGTDHAGKYCS